MEHAEDFCSSVSEDDQYYEGYADLGVHRLMLSDKPRMDFYKRLLSDPTIVRDRVVVDVGSGTGVLTAWAALAGAAHVLSIEASAMADLQPLVFAENNITDRVTVVHATVEALVEAGPAAFVATHRAALAGRRVAVLVSEWMGFYLFHEGMLPSVLAARDFFEAVNALLEPTAPGAAEADVRSTRVELIPSSARLLAAPVRLSPLYTQRFETFWGCVEGVKMTSLGRMAFDLTVNGASPLVEVLPAECLLIAPGSAAVVWQHDLATLRREDLAEVSGSAAFTLCVPPCTSAMGISGSESEDARDVAVDGFALWFDVRHGDVVLDTSPEAPPTHWKQTTMLLPLEAREEKLVSVAALQGSTLDVNFTLRSVGPGSRLYKIEFELS